MKIIFFGTANVALPILEELHKNHEVLAVVTTPDVKVGRKQLLEESPVSALATDLELPLFKPENVKDNSEFVEQLKKLSADIFVVVAYGKILPIEIINLPQFKTINVHFSLLPKYRGPSPIQAALLNGDTQTGTSIFVLDANVDDGPLLVQQSINIDADDNYFTLSDKLARLSAKIINSTIHDYTSGKITPLPQDESQVSHTKIITKDDGKIDWTRSANQIYNQFRAFYIWPGVWTTWNGKLIKITDCLEYNPNDPNAAIRMTQMESVGTVSDGGIVVCADKSFLKINRLQLAGKNEVSIEEFLNGYREFMGSKLE